jgi:hypothetical protein
VPRPRRWDPTASTAARPPGVTYCPCSGASRRGPLEPCRWVRHGREPHRQPIPAALRRLTQTASAVK